jgi:pimeloyl-ACP methyl ester carboxylesterase
VADYLGRLAAAGLSWPLPDGLDDADLELHGTEDVLVPLANAKALTKLIPGARRYWFEGCGHLFFHEDPDRTAQVILSFLRGS